jgi:hypothetical protein
MNHFPTPAAPDPAIPSAFQAGLQLLLQAARYAEDFGRDAWAFAVELPALHAAGLTNNDLRWMVCKGFLAHALEQTTGGQQQERTFRPAASLTFNRRSCFVLTPAGLTAARLCCERAPRDAGGWPGPNDHAGRCSNGDASHRTPLGQPTWDVHRRELRVGALLVKQFKLPSPNQEMILTVFEEELWPPRIDDPLPPHQEVDPKRRLHDTIKSLNRNQKNRLIRFMGDGSGEGIRWEFITSDAPAQGANGRRSKRAQPV